MKKMLLVACAFSLSTTLFAKEYIIKFKDAATLRQKSINIKGVGKIPFLDTHDAGSLAQIDLNQKGKAEAKALVELMKNPKVEYVVENYKVHTMHDIDFTVLKDQWQIAKVNAEQAWNTAGNTGSQNVVVAVIDTGVDYRHESLAANMVAGFDFKDNDNDPWDEYDPDWQTSRKNPGHGTHCAGIVGATGVVEGGVVGLSPRVSIMPLRFLGKDGSGDLMKGIKAIDHAIKKGVEVISASWGASTNAAGGQPLAEAVKRASDAGIIFVAAAGNGDAQGVGFSNDTMGMYPANANYENTITVAASDAEDAKTAFSNFGRHSVHLAAPGAKIMSALPDQNYAALSGTSMATPLVAGLVALIKAQNPNYTGMQIRSIIQQTAVRTQIETACNCRIDAGSAVAAVMNNTPVLVPYAYSFAPNTSVQFEMLNAIGNVTYQSSNPQVASFDSAGRLSGHRDGEVSVTATDSAGNTLRSGGIHVWTRTSSTAMCPLGNQITCMLMCAIDPTLPWCEGQK